MKRDIATISKRLEDDLKINGEGKIDSREASFDDLEGVIDLLNRNDMDFKNKDKDEWLHIWKENPLIADGRVSWPIGWVLERDDKRIVGFVGNIPILYRLKGKDLIAASATSWVVEAPYRNWSLSLVSSFLSQDGADLYLDVTANDAAEKILLAFKAKKIPLDSYETSLYWIINYQKFVSSALIKNGLPSGNLMTLPPSLAMWAIDKIARRVVDMRDTDKINMISSFDERFDAFWEALKNRNNILLCARDSKWLDWHFKYALKNKRIWIFVRESGGRLTSYAIFLRQDNTKIGLKRVKLVDFQTIDDEPAAISGFISRAISRCREEGIYVLESVGLNSRKIDLIKKIYPRERRLSNWHFLYKTKDASLAKDLEGPGAWDPTSFDGDASL